jgi:hypothetical protein
MDSNNALKVDALCHRIIGDIGSIHARLNMGEDGTVKPMSPELAALRNHVREISDTVRERHPNVFFK